jgi:hypothetical protein
MKEVSDLSLYKKMRHDLAKELELTKQTIQKNEERHKRQLDELERKFIAAKEALQKEAAERIAHSRKVYKEEVGKELDYESKLVRKKNREMSKELKFHEKRSNELMTENQRLQALVKKLKIDMSLTEEKEKAYALRGVKQKRLIREATEKQKALEMSLTQALREFDLEREATEMENSRVVQELQQGVDKNRHIAVLRDKELRVIRKNAKVLLKNRQEMEQFFLEAMDTVKQQIREERRAEHALAVQTHQHHIRSLAQNSASGQRYAARTPAPRAPSKDVELKDLTLEDREKVLRLLFSKINNVQARNSSHLPPHSFDISVHQEGPLLLEGEHDGEEDGQQPDETFLTNMDTPL